MTTQSTASQHDRLVAPPQLPARTIERIAFKVDVALGFQEVVLIQMQPGAFRRPPGLQEGVYGLPARIPSMVVQVIETKWKKLIMARCRHSQSR